MFKKIFGITTEKDNNEVNLNDLYDEIEVLKEEIETHLETIEKKEKDVKELSFKVTVLTATLRDKEEDIRNLNDKLDTLTEKMDKPNSVTEKLFQTIKDRDIMIDTLKKENDNLRKTVVLDIKETPVEEILNPELINYRLLIKDYYEARKFEEFKKICQDNDFIYVDDLKSMDFDTISLSKTKAKNAQNHYEDYLNKKLDNQTITYLLKGHHISDYFFRFRSFVNFCKERDLTYVIELDNFDFYQLANHKFTPDQIQKIEDTLKELNTVHRIRR